MDNIGIVVDDLAAATAFFVALGLELEGGGTVEGSAVDRIVGPEGARSDIATMRSPDGHGRFELTTYHTPSSRDGDPRAPANTLGMHRIMFAVEDIDDILDRLRAHGPNSSASWCGTRTATGSANSAAPQASSSRWPSRPRDRSVNGPAPDRAISSIRAALQHS